MNRIAIGTAQFGMDYGVANRAGKIDEPEATAIVSLARHFGVDTIDTASVYGESENLLGDICKGEMKIVTKLPPLPKSIKRGRVESWIRVALEESLQRLKRESVYGMLVHRPEDLLGRFGKEVVRTLMQLEDEEIVSKAGVSIYSPALLSPIFKGYKFRLVQAPFNVLDQRLKTTGWLFRLKKLGVEVHARSTFLQGLLLMSQNDIPEWFHPWSGFFAVWHQNLNVFKVSALEACLKFSLSHAEIDRVLVGVDSARQLNEIFEASFSRNHFDTIMNFSSLACDDEMLINPTNWVSQ